MSHEPRSGVQDDGRAVRQSFVRTSTGQREKTRTAEDWSCGSEVVPAASSQLSAYPDSFRFNVTVILGQVVVARISKLPLSRNYSALSKL